MEKTFKIKLNDDEDDTLQCLTDALNEMAQDIGASIISIEEIPNA